VEATLNPPGQYADDRNLRARQRFWQHQDQCFDDVGWVLDLAGPSPGMRVLDARPGRARGPGRDTRLAMRPATHAFTAENAAAQLGAAFKTVTCVRPASYQRVLSPPSSSWPTSSNGVVVAAHSPEALPRRRLRLGSGVVHRCS
jgi:hypothetical protein